jgi:hypothetical protein
MRSINFTGSMAPQDNAQSFNEILPPKRLSRDLCTPHHRDLLTTERNLRVTPHRIDGQRTEG